MAGDGDRCRFGLNEDFYMDEAKFIVLYRELTGCTESFARSVYIHVLAFHVEERSPEDVENKPKAVTSPMFAAARSARSISEAKPRRRPRLASA